MSTADLLYSIQLNVSRIGDPILIAVGSLSCILNLIVFRKNTLRKNPCTMCFMAINIVNFLCFYLSILIGVLASGYDIDPSASSIVFCRFRYYIALLLACLESSYIILASIDRTLITSSNARIRKFSRRRLITVSIISIAVFWMVFHIHALILTEILQFGPNYFVCYYQPGAYTTFMTYYALVINGVLPPVLMAIFGFWTVKNVRAVRRAKPHSRAMNAAVIVVGRQYTLQSKDHQLIRMLLVDIVTFVICKCPSSFFAMYQQITQYVEKSAEQQSIEQSILMLTFFWYYIENAISCYTNILVSKTFRTELKGILLNIRLH